MSGRYSFLTGLKALASAAANLLRSLPRDTASSPIGEPYVPLYWTLHQGEFTPTITSSPVPLREMSEAVRTSMIRDGFVAMDAKCQSGDGYVIIAIPDSAHPSHCIGAHLPSGISACAPVARASNASSRKGQRPDGEAVQGMWTYRVWYGSVTGRNWRGEEILVSGRRGASWPA